MKKLCLIALALVLALALAACGAKEAVQDAVRGALDESAPAAQPAASVPDAPQPPKEEAPASEAPADEDPPQGAAMEGLLDWMMGGTFSYDYTQTSEYEGQVTESSGSVAMDGGNMSIASETMVSGVSVKSRILIMDGFLYIIDDASRSILKMQQDAGLDMTAGMPTDYSEMAALGSGEGEVNGRVLPYEEYEVEGVSAKYYMDGGAVYAIETEYEGAYTLMIITNAKNTVPAGAFNMPEGYTEIAM